MHTVKAMLHLMWSHSEMHETPTLRTIDAVACGTFQEKQTLTSKKIAPPVLEAELSSNVQFFATMEEFDCTKNNCTLRHSKKSPKEAPQGTLVCHIIDMLSTNKLWWKSCDWKAICSHSIIFKGMPSRDKHAHRYDTTTARSSKCSKNPIKAEKSVRNSYAPIAYVHVYLLQRWKSDAIVKTLVPTISVMNLLYFKSSSRHTTAFIIEQEAYLKSNASRC